MKRATKKDEYTMDIEGFNLPNEFIHKMDKYIKLFSYSQLQFLKESIILYSSNE